MPKVKLTALPLGSRRLLTRTDGLRHRVGDEFEVSDHELRVLQEQPGIDVDVIASPDPDPPAAPPGEPSTPPEGAPRP